MEDFIEVREVLEVLAVKMAIIRCSDQEISVLEEVHNAYIKAVDQNNVTDTTRFDEEFHNQIFLMTKNILLINLNRLVTEEFRKYRVMSFSMHENQYSAVDLHKRVLDAIKRRDGSGGIKQMQHHIQVILSDMEKILAGM